MGGEGTFGRKSVNQLYATKIYNIAGYAKNKKERRSVGALFIIYQINSLIKISNHDHGHDGHDHSHYHYIRYGICHDGTCGFRILRVPRNPRLLIL